MINIFDVIEDDRGRRDRDEGGRIASVKLVYVFVIVIVIISRNAETLRPIEFDGFALLENGVSIRTETIDGGETTLESFIAVFIGSIPRTRGSVRGDNDQPGVEGNSSSFDLNVKRVTVKKLEKKSEREPGTMKIVKNNDLLVLVTIPPFGVVFVIGVWVDSGRKVGLSQTGRSVKDKNVSFEPSLGNGGKTIEGRDSIVLGNDRERFGVAPDVLDRNTGVEALLEEKKVSSLSLLGLFAKGPRAVDSRLLLGTVDLGFFMSSTAQLPVGAGVDELQRIKRFVGLETGVTLIVRSTLLTLLKLPDAVFARPAPRVLLGLGIVQGEHPEAALYLGWHRRCRWIGFFSFFLKNIYLPWSLGYALQAPKIFLSTLCSPIVIGYPPESGTFDRWI